MRRESTLHLFGSVQLFALLGDRLKQFTLVGMLGMLVPGSSFELLKLTLFSQVPILIFTPLVGSLIDRWNKPAAIVGACVIRAVIVMCIPFFYDHTHTIYAFYIAAFVTSIFDLVFAPARSALLPEVVPAERFLGVNALFWTLGIIGTLTTSHGTAAFSPPPSSMPAPPFSCCRWSSRTGPHPT
jgi:MFS family permease